MIYTVNQFCDFVEQDLNGFIDELGNNTIRHLQDNEKKELAESYIQVSQMLAIAKKKRPQIGNVNITTTNLLLEYKLPAASAWCDLVMIGKGYGQQQVVIIELKNWVKNTTDAPGVREGLILHKGKQYHHPADQVRGYTEYCQRFHSVVQNEKAKVSGCVYFTKDIDLTPYEAFPNDVLSNEYPLYNTLKADALAEYITDRIEESDSCFAENFVKGEYKQDRNILRQVAKTFSQTEARPFVLLDEQRRGFSLIMDAVEKNTRGNKKQVFIVSGPPGSGKSAVAVNLWAESVLKFTMKGDVGNVVYVTTSASQNDNWSKIFADVAGKKAAKHFVVKASSYKPGMTGTTMVNKYLPIFKSISKKYVGHNTTGDENLKYEYFEDYTNYMIEHGEAVNYRDNLHFMSIVDEAHALINPLVPGFAMDMSWCNQMGPQVYHIIRESKISVFFTDEKQSFRDQETTNIEDIEKWAKHLNAEVTKISLDKLQFRCAGSTDYEKWISAMFTKEPLHNVSMWNKHFKFTLVDYPSELDEKLSVHIKEGDKSVRLLSSYTQTWVSSNVLNENHDNNDAYDFILKDKDNKEWKKYWNYAKGGKRYDIFVQGTEDTKMAEDPLSEVGCPYVVRGFDFNYVGVLWLNDIVWRKGKWMIDFTKANETANKFTKSRALKEQVNYARSIGIRNPEIRLVEADNPRFPLTCQFFKTIQQTYRILFTRVMKGVYLYIQDKETREYVRSLINS